MADPLILASVVFFVGAVVFLTAACERRRAAREFGEHLERFWNLFGEFVDHCQAQSDTNAFLAVQRKNAAKRKASETADEEKTGVEFRWVE